MKNPQRGSTTITLLTIIILLAIGFGLYVYFQNNKPSQQIEDNQTASTSQSAVLSNTSINQISPNNVSSATIDNSSLVISSLDSTSTITGAATNSNPISVEIIASTPAKFNPYTTLYGSGNVPVINGRWSFSIPAQKSSEWFTNSFNPLTVEVGTVNQAGNVNVLATGTLNIIPSYEGNVSIAIDQKSLASTSSFPQITGTATNVSSIAVDINGFVPNDGSDSRGEVALYAGTVPVINNKWSFSPSTANEAHGGPQGLSRGTYTVVVGKTEQTPFVFSTLVVSQP